MKFWPCCNLSLQLFLSFLTNFVSLKIDNLSGHTYPLMSEDYFLYYNCLSYLNFLIFKLITSFNYFTTFYSLKFKFRKECEELEADERNIDSKIKKKQEELDRTEKRLKSLENVRPQFMDEVCTRSE